MKRILVPIDFSETSLFAMKYALLIANKLGASLRIVHVKTGANFAPEFARDAMEMRLHNQAEDWLNNIHERYRGEYRVPGGSFDMKIREGNVFHQIANQALYDDTTLIVVGSHGVSGFTGRWIGSNAYRLASNAPCPVLILRPDMTFSDEFGRMVIPINLQTGSRKKIPVAAGVAKLFHTKIYLAGLRRSNIAVLLSVLTATLGQAERYLKDVARLEVSGKTTLIGKDLPAQLVAYSSDVKADLLAIDRITNKNPFVDNIRPFLNDVINQSQCPVLVIPVKE